MNTETHHPEWSASASARNWVCPGSLTLAQTVPEKPESEAAAWGTACYAIAAACLKQGHDAVDYVEREINTKLFSFIVDDEMANTAQKYIDYIRARLSTYLKATNTAATLDVEVASDLAPIKPPFAAGGTTDTVLWFPAWKLLEIVDLKGGRRVVVEATDNLQLRTYALGAVLGKPGDRIERVQSTIVQPRAQHKDGYIRSEDYHIADLLEWTVLLLTTMRRAKEAQDTRATMAAQAWADAYLKTGPQCRWCPASGVCAAQERLIFDVAGVHFDNNNTVQITHIPDKMDAVQLALTLDLAEHIEAWIAAVRTFAHFQAEGGKDIPGYILVPKHGREKWRDAAAEQTVLTVARRLGLPEHAYLNPCTLRTPKQIREALTRARAASELECLEDLSITPENGTNLVRADKTTRTAAVPTAKRLLFPLD